VRGPGAIRGCPIGAYGHYSRFESKQISDPVRRIASASEPEGGNVQQLSEHGACHVIHRSELAGVDDASPP
jgi:hypothetical protein